MAAPSPDIPTDPRELLALIVDGSSEAVYAQGADGRIAVWNASAERLYGHGRDEALGRPVTDLVPEHRRVEHDEIVARALGGERIEHYETEQLVRGGVPVQVSLTVSAVRDAAGEIWGVSTFARDIGERRAMELELARTRAELERHLVELERSNADLEQFAYVASHDLSEPLRAISGMLDLLREEYGERLEGEAGEYVDRSVAAALRLRRLIEALLEYSRVGRADLALQEVDCQRLVEDITAELVPGGAGASVVQAQDLPTVLGDPGQLRRVFENLLGNALKFNDAAEPLVTVSAEPEAGGWKLAVEDNGIGIPPPQRERIFQVFKRLHPRDAYPGTGIGLAICRRIVERHGGHISAEPCSGRGSRLVLTLPHHPEGSP